MTPSRKLKTSAGLFALTLVLVAAAAATQSAAPLFVAWVPLALVAWVLTRPGPEWEPSKTPARDAADETGRVPDNPSPTDDVATS